MDEPMTELVVWLREQIDEDERVAKVATSGGPWYEDGMSIRGSTRMNHTDVLVVRHTWPQEAAHIVRHDPARVLLEVEAKRQILDDHAGPPENYADYCEADGWCRNPNDSDLRERMPCRYVRLLALPYADRPGYRDEWRP